MGTGIPSKTSTPTIVGLSVRCLDLDAKYTAPLLPQDTDTANGKIRPPWIKRVEDIFDDPQFFIDGASATDVHQGSGGDCWFLAALMAVSAKKELIENLCVARNEKMGVYGFVFYRGQYMSQLCHCAAEN